MLDITSILNDAIETCGLDIENEVEDALRDTVDNILFNNNVKSLLKDAIKSAAERKGDEILDLLEDAVDDYAKEAVEDAF